MGQYKEKQRILHEEMEAEYEQAMREAQSALEAGELSTSNHSHTYVRQSRRRTRRTKKCSIM